MNKLKTKTTRLILFFIGDVLLLSAAALLSYLILGVVIPAGEMYFPLADLLIYGGASIATLAMLGMYNIHWRFVSLHELVRIAKGLTIGVGVYLPASLVMHGFTNYYPAFIFITYIHSLLFISGFRISKRIYLEVIRRPKQSTGVLIFGAGNAGEQIVRDVQRNNEWGMNIEAIFDDKRELWGTSIHDIPVLGGRSKLFDYIKFRQVKEIIVAVPSIPKKVLKEIIDRVKDINPKQIVKVLPSFHKLDDEVSCKNIRDIRIEDVLGRESAEIDFSEIKSNIAGKRVLITGAGGSIGAEMVRQMIKFKPEMIIALDIDETELYHLEHEIENLDEKGLVEPYVADVTDRRKIENMFQRRRPQVVFHAAAYKHVPMMEKHPEEAVRVNVGGMQILADISCRNDVEKFILISTDKAVNPTNVMGATKQISEQICMSYNDNCTTNFMSVRFGNVLGSRGSVVPLFIDQIEAGGPVTITHPEVKRYFMTIPEAVLLVMQAGVMGEGGEVFLLDMGEPVKIIDMARQLIKLHGLEPETDIPIVFKGLRPGEKLYEELLGKEEGHVDTLHPLISKASCTRALSNGQLEYVVAELNNSAKAEDPEAIRQILKRLVPAYKYNGELAKVAYSSE